MKKILFLSFVCLVSSCYRSLLDSPDSAYFNITTIKTALVKHVKKSKSGCSEVAFINSFEPLSKTGICFEYKANKYINGNAAPFKEGGLVEKIQNIKVFLGNDFVQKNLSAFLVGEKDYTHFYWYNPNLEFSRRGYNSTDCSSMQYCENLSEWQRIMNNGLERLKIEGYNPNITYFYWFTKAGLKEINFKPTYLKMEMTFQDSTTQRIRMVKDSIVLK
jgi:hypothetical protein